MLEQFIGLVLGCLSIIPRDTDVQVLWQGIATQRINLAERALSYQRRIRAFALRQRNSHRRKFWIRSASRRSFRACKQYVVLWLTWAVLDLLDNVAQVDRPCRVDSHNNLPQFLRAHEKISGFDSKFLVVVREGSSLRALVRAAQLHEHGARRQTVSREPLCVQDHAQFAALPADDGGLGNIVQLLQRRVQFSCNLSQPVGVVLLAPKRQRQNRHVVDGARLDNWLRNTLRNAVKVGIKLVVRLDDRIFFFRPNVKPNDYHAQPGTADRVDVFDSGHLPQQFFHRHRDALRHFLGRCSRHLHKNIQHGDNDLRLFFARCL